MNDFTRGYMRGYKDAQKEALAQPSVSVEQKPVGTFFVQHWRGLENQHFDADGHGLPDGEYKLYTTPYVATPRPQRTAAEGEDTRRAWVGLTEDQINQAYADSYKGILLHEAIEAKLMENNT